MVVVRSNCSRMGVESKSNRSCSHRRAGTHAWFLSLFLCAIFPAVSKTVDKSVRNDERIVVHGSWTSGVADARRDKTSGSNCAENGRKRRGGVVWRRWHAVWKSIPRIRKPRAGAVECVRVFFLKWNIGRVRRAVRYSMRSNMVAHNAHYNSEWSNRIMKCILRSETFYVSCDRYKVSAGR